MPAFKPFLHTFTIKTKKSKEEIYKTLCAKITGDALTDTFFPMFTLRVFGGEVHKIISF